MRPVFTFSWLCKSLDFQVLFKTPGHIASSDFGEAIKNAAQTVLYPDGIIILTTDHDCTEILSRLQEEPICTDLNRLGQRTGVYIAQINANRGNVHFTRSVRVTKSTKFILDKLKDQKTLTDLMNTGIRCIFSNARIVIPAPSGYHFHKPSGDRSSHFIRAEEALTNSEIVDFLALSLMVKMGERSNLEKIYIDTMGISSVAYALRELLRSSNPSNVPKIISFHSHEGIDKIEAPIPGTSFCIISASSSLSLEKKWKRLTNCNDNEVVTLLTFNSAEGSENAIFSLDPPATWDVRQDASLWGTKSMRTLGERFQQEQLPPKKITLSWKYHPLENVKKLAKRFCSHPFIDIDVSVPNDKRRVFFVNGDILVKDENFTEWLEKEVRSRIPASVQGIIYQDDPSSYCMALQCKKYLKDFGISLPWGVRNSTEYEEHVEKLEKHRALLIVAAIVGQGHTMLGISRDLRAHHVGNKSYLVGLQICATNRESTFLKSNLSQTKDGTNYYSLWNCLATGVALHQSLDSQERLGKSHTILETLLATRKDRLVHEGLGKKSLLPTADRNKPLALRKDFLFWPECYDDGPEHVGLLLATIGAILENARTSIEIPAEHRLSSDTFQQVLLDPWNFNRYNDGIIQAALLRQALPSELDYSYIGDESEFMRDFLIKIFSARKKPQGEAALEFALALATQRLKLKANDLEMVYNVTSKSLSTRLAFDRRLGALLDHAIGRRPNETMLF